MLKLASEATGEVARRRLVWLTGALLGLTVVHDLDHVRQGRALGFELYGVALAALTMLTVTLVLLLHRHAMAAPAAIVVGVSTVLGVVAVHVAPSRPFFSDPYAAAHADALSWAIIILMMLGGVALAVAGWRSLRPLGGRPRLAQ